MNSSGKMTSSYLQKGKKKGPRTKPDQANLQHVLKFPQSMPTMQAIWLCHSNYTFRLPECEAPKHQQPKGWLTGVSRSTRTRFLYVQGPGPLAQAIRQAGKQICQIKLLTKTLPNIIAYQVFTPVTTLLATEVFFPGKNQKEHQEGIGGFPKWGYPQNHPVLIGWSIKPSIFGG